VFFIDTIFEKEPKALRWAIVGTSVLHIFLGLIAGLQNKPLREIGVVFTILGIAAFIEVIWTAFIHPLEMIKTLLLILIPGMIAIVLVRMVLYGALLAMAAAPIAAFIEILKTIMMIYGII